MDKIGSFSLSDAGAFNVKIEFVYWDSSNVKHHVSGTGGFGGTKRADPGAYGVPDGSTVSLYVAVVGGTANQAKEQFIYQKGSGGVAAYKITGTTLNSSLTLLNVTGGPEIGISTLPAPSTAFGKTLSSGKVQLFPNTNWTDSPFEIDTSRYVPNARHSISGSWIQDKTSWVAFNLPIGTVMTLANNVVPNPPNGRMADLKDLGQVVDLVGTGGTECVDLTKLDMNDKVSSFFYRQVDLAFGAIELFVDSSFTGNRTIVFLSEWPGNKVHSLSGWHIDDRGSAARWSTLQDTQSATLYEDTPDSSGTVTTGAQYPNIAGWLTQKDAPSFAEANFNDKISAFSWTGLTPKKEVVKDLAIELDSYADYSSGLTQNMTGHNDSSTESTQTITLTKTDAETTTVTTTNSYTPGVKLDVERQKMYGPAKWSVNLELSFTYTHTDERTVSDTKTESIQLSQTFTVPPYCDYDATLIVYMGEIPDNTYKTTADRWYDVPLPDSVYDPTNNGWYKRTEDVYVEVRGMLACKSDLQIHATPLPAASLPLPLPVVEPPVVKLFEAA